MGVVLTRVQCGIGERILHSMAGRRWVMLLSGVAVALALALWLASGREGFTKAARSVTVEVRDELFGDTVTREEFQQGPILGYFVGLDAVGLTAAAGVLATGLAWVLWWVRGGRSAGTDRRQE